MEKMTQGDHSYKRTDNDTMNSLQAYGSPNSCVLIGGVPAGRMTTSNPRSSLLHNRCRLKLVPNVQDNDVVVTKGTGVCSI